jgi:oligopeptidase B
VLLHCFTLNCLQFCTQERYTSPAKLAIEGRSAGGLLMGAVTNMRPDLFNAVMMGVPFVDVLTTMLDETIPLTTIGKQLYSVTL